jgi:hypothetical protein
MEQIRLTTAGEYLQMAVERKNMQDGLFKKKKKL